MVKLTLRLKGIPFSSNQNKNIISLNTQREKKLSLK